VDQDGEAPFFTATAEAAGDRLGVRITGEVDMSTADQMFATAAAPGATAVTLDLTGVTFFDSAAIHALVRLAERYPGTLEVLPSPQVRRVLDIAGLSGQSWLRTSD
jgi:anti-anti-sigma factor